MHKMILKATQLLCSITVLLISSGCKKDAFDPDSVDGPKIVLAEQSITIDGKQISLPLMIEALVAELGEPDETHNLHNTIWVWNELGVYCYTKPASSIVHDISLGFSFEDFDFHPTRSFGGIVSVGNDHIYKGTDQSALIASGFSSDPGISDQLTKEIGGISIYVNTLDDTITSASYALPQSGAEQAGAGQPATRSKSDSKGGDKPQPESEGRSR